ncbi:MAG: 2-succinyl-6-hydroxy-2,4-cyclohexadiene-1-carboxylate synthase [Mastigocoleus sp.]
MLNYKLIGKPDNPIILFLHGFMGNTKEFDQVIYLLSKNFYCLTVDLPGHGETRVLRDEDLQMANTARCVIQLLDNLLDELKDNELKDNLHNHNSNNRQCILVGYSMGGRLSLYLSLHYPEYFSQVILESASPGLKTESQRQERIKTDAQIARKLKRIQNQDEFKLFLENWYKQPIFGNIKNHPQYSQVINIRLQNNPTLLAKSLEIMGTGSQPSLWNKLQTNNLPILLILGERDTKFVHINQQMHDLFKRSHRKSQLKVIENVGHNIHFENPSIFVRAIEDFLKVST